MGDIGKLIRNIARGAAVLVTLCSSWYALYTWSNYRNKTQGQANYQQYTHLLKLADVDENGAISPIEKKLLMERVPFLKDMEKYGRDINQVTVGSLTPACMFRDQQVYSAVKKYEEELR